VNKARGLCKSNVLRIVEREAPAGAAVRMSRDEQGILEEA
jgi:hypothetical protein